MFEQTNEQQGNLFMFQFSSAFSKIPQLAIGTLPFNTAIDGFQMTQVTLSNNFDLSVQVLTETGVIVKWKR